MKHELKKALEAARPSLRTVSPLAWWIMLVMGVFNLILGASLLFAIDSDRFSAPLLIVNKTFTFEMWGSLFILLGVIKLYSLWKNDWDLSRKTLLFGVATKAAWAVALTIRSFVSPGTIFVNIIWVALALIQMGTYVFFMPPAFASYKQRRVERELQ